MQFDDRLATVLRMQAGSARAAGTQYRQLLDLVGSAPAGADGELLEDAYARLVVLSHEISDDLRARIVAEQGLRLRNPELVSFLAGFDLPTAAAALSSARLDEVQWNALIPALPGPLRALLRHRRDLPDGTLKLLGDLGVGDLGLPEPDAEVTEMETAAFNDIDVLELAEPGEPIGEVIEPMGEVLELDPALELADDDRGGIGALVRRIEAFRKARNSSLPIAANQDAPLLPLGEETLLPGRAQQAFDFTTDAEGRIDWAEPAMAPMAVGMALASEFAGAPALADDTLVSAMRHRQPIRAARVILSGAPAIEGEWQVDAVPDFTVPAGRFTGYRGRMRRPVEAMAVPVMPPAGADSASDRIRQMLHELRTPVNAIQGFAEIIQQQVFGPAPNEYRALAATIAGDAARMLAGFEELDRLARLEAGALELDRGASDFRAIAMQTARQLDGVLRPRSAGLELDAPLVPCPVTLARHDAELLVWRVLATLAGAVSPGEALQLALADRPGHVRLRIDLPAALADRDEVFDSFAPARSQAVMSGMFGAGFTLRLARAEARAVGGDLVRDGDNLVLTLPRAAALPAENNRKAVD
jgi:two-component system OmpR family sensor kinase